MVSSENSFQKAARIACGWGAALYGESSEGQWTHLAKWAGFDSWDTLLTYVNTLDKEVPPDLLRALAAIERRKMWENFSDERERRAELAARMVKALDILCSQDFHDHHLQYGGDDAVFDLKSVAEALRPGCTKHLP